MLSINMAVKTINQSKNALELNKGKKYLKKKVNKRQLKEQKSDARGSGASMRDSRRKSSDKLREILKKVHPRSLVEVFLTESHREKISLRGEKILKFMDFLVLLIALFGMFLFMWENELYYEQIHKPGDKKIIKRKEVNSFTLEEKDESIMCTTLRVILLFSTLSFDVLLFIRYKLVLKLKKLKFELDIHESLFSSKMAYFLFLEVIACLIISYPRVNKIFHFDNMYSDVLYSFDELACDLQFIRVFYLWRIWSNYSKFNNKLAKELCYLSNAKGGVKFAVKAEINRNPFIFISTGVFACSIIFGYTLRSAERTFEFFSGLNWDYIWNGMWCIQTLITTVGYGDFFPSTHFGRIIVTFVCLFGSFIISLVNVGIHNRLAFSKPESRAFERIKSFEYYREFEVLAANVIKTTMQFYVTTKSANSEKRNSMVFRKIDYIFPKLKLFILEFKTKRNFFLYMRANKRIDEIIPKKMKLFNTEMNDIKFSLKTLSNIMNKIKTIEEKNKIINLRLSDQFEKVSSIQKDLHVNFKEHLPSARIDETKFLLSEEVITRRSFLQPMKLAEVKTNLRRTSQKLSLLMYANSCRQEEQQQEISSPLKRIRDRKKTTIKNILIKNNNEESAKDEKKDGFLKIETKKQLLTADEILHTISARRKKSGVMKKKKSVISTESVYSTKKISRMNSKVSRVADYDSNKKLDTSIKTLTEEKVPARKEATGNSHFTQCDSLRKSTSILDRAGLKEENSEKNNQNPQELSESSKNTSRNNISFDQSFDQKFKRDNSNNLSRLDSFSPEVKINGFIPGFVNLDAGFNTFIQDSINESNGSESNN